MNILYSNTSVFSEKLSTHLKNRSLYLNFLSSIKKSREFENMVLKYTT